MQEDEKEKTPMQLKETTGGKRFNIFNVMLWLVLVDISDQTLAEPFLYSAGRFVAVMAARTSAPVARLFCAFDPTSLRAHMLLFICLFCNKNVWVDLLAQQELGVESARPAGDSSETRLPIRRSKHVASCVREMIENSV